MARPAKPVTLYSSTDEVVVSTIRDFLEAHPTIVRNNLYRKWGAHDLNGTHWRIGSKPILTRLEDEYGCRETVNIG